MMKRDMRLDKIGSLWTLSIDKETRNSLELTKARSKKAGSCSSS
jgi:hypothetical protein